MRSINQLLAVASLPVVVAVAACSTNQAAPTGLKVSNVPAAIAVPSGNKLAFTLHGSGLQHYECRAKAGVAGSYDWVFTAPEAALYDRSDAIVGRHYGGPTWEYGDDSKVTGKVIAETPAPDSNAGNIAWLLLQGTPVSRGGVLNGVTYIQRVNTDGGVAPTELCSAATAGTKKGVRYSADYLFYKG